MRTLSVCQAEVFRRSEKRIQQRRVRRKRILAATVPLMLCVCLLVWLVPDGKKPSVQEKPHTDFSKDAIVPPAESYYGMLGEAPEQLEGFSNAFVPDEAVCITLSYGKVEERITDQNVVSQVYGVLKGGNSVLDDDKPAAPETNNDQIAAGTQLEQYKDHTTAYTLTVTMADGSTQAYHISDNTLVNEKTGDTTILTAQQQKQLDALLGQQERSTE